MKVTLWGCRGSVAAPGRDTARYGGNTSCVEVRLDDGVVILLDAGTGLRNVGQRLAEERVATIHLFLSHLHLDHLQGLAFFAPLWDENVELHIWGPASPLRDLEDRIATYMSEPLFPVNLFDIPCRAHFHDAPDATWPLGAASISSCAVVHQGPTVGYRIEEKGRSLVYLSDHEPFLGAHETDPDPAWVSGAGLAYEADVLMHDAQYSDEEYREHVGWGHSSVRHAVEFARLTRVEQLVLFHHDPSHADAQLELLARHAAELWGAGGTPPAVAYDGMVITL